MIRPMVVENHVVQRTVAARQMTTMTMTLAPSQMMSFFSLPTATATGNPAIGNGKGAIDEKTNGSGVTKGGAAAIAVVLILRKQLTIKLMFTTVLILDKFSSE